MQTLVAIGGAPRFTEQQRIRLKTKLASAERNCRRPGRRHDYWAGVASRLRRKLYGDFGLVMIPSPQFGGFLADLQRLESEVWHSMGIPTELRIGKKDGTYFIEP